VTSERSPSTVTLTGTSRPTNCSAARAIDVKAHLPLGRHLAARPRQVRGCGPSVSSARAGHRVSLAVSVLHRRGWLFPALGWSKSGFRQVDRGLGLGSVVPGCGLLAQPCGECGKVEAVPSPWRGDHDFGGGQSVPVFPNLACPAFGEGPAGVVGTRADPRLA